MNTDCRHARPRRHQVNPERAGCVLPVGAFRNLSDSIGAVIKESILVIVIDASALVSALLGPGGKCRFVLRRTLEGGHIPLVGQALFAEYEAAIGKESLFGNCAISRREREELLDALLSCCRWTRVYYTWRPNSPDESDNHVVELAVAGGAQAIVTKNVRDFKGMELRFAGLRILSPGEFAKE